MDWYRELFLEDYLKIAQEEDTEGETRGVIELLDLYPKAHILDLCCGYGRHAQALAQHDYRVTGLDLSSALLARARAQTSDVAWVNADMRAIPFTETFDAVINLFTAFGYFDDAANFSVLREVARTLKPGGKFLLDVVNRDFLIRHFEPRDFTEIGEVVLLQERDFNLFTSQLEGRWTVVESNGTKKVYEHQIRVYSFTELRNLLEATGLHVVGAWSGFERQALDWDANRLVILSQKPK